jgi:hypothetical protein
MWLAGVQPTCTNNAVFMQEPNMQGKGENYALHGVDSQSIEYEGIRKILDPNITWIV